MIDLLTLIISHIGLNISLFLAVFTRCPEDPEKTLIHLVAHANPGVGVPQWAAKTAVNALAPIEPFKMFNKINENVQRSRPQLRERLEQAEMVGSNLPNGRSPRPAGMAQLGYACFWPNGGGTYEGHARTSADTTEQGSFRGHEKGTDHHKEENETDEHDGSKADLSQDSLVESS